MAQTLKIGGKPLGEVYKGGQLFIGSEGMLISDYNKHLLLPEEKFAGFKPPEQTIPKSIGHHREWVEAIKTGGTTMCNFDYSGRTDRSGAARDDRLSQRPADRMGRGQSEGEEFARGPAVRAQGISEGVDAVESATVGRGKSLQYRVQSTEYSSR